MSFQLNSNNKKSPEVIDDEIVETLNNIQRSKFEKEINYLVNIRETKGKSASIFKLRDKVIGNISK